MFFDPLYFIIVAPGILLALWTSFRVKRTFAKYQKVALSSRMSGAEVARAILDREGIQGVRIEQQDGWLSDHYDPKQKVVRLSPEVFQGRSVSSVGVAAHEVGHAIQHSQSYAPMMVRQSLVFPASAGSTLSYFLVFIGFMMHSAGMVWAGIFLFSFVVLFQLVTLPVEFNASSRARATLVNSGMISHVEDVHVGKVLNAAAMTYLAALVSSILTLLFYVLRASGSRSDE